MAGLVQVSLPVLCTRAGKRGGVGGGTVRVSVRLATKARGDVMEPEVSKRNRHLSKATYPGSVQASLLGGQYGEGGDMDVTHDENHRVLVGV